jgi:hypothetical protein
LSGKWPRWGLAEEADEEYGKETIVLEKQDAAQPNHAIIVNKSRDGKRRFSREP